MILLAAYAGLRVSEIAAIKSDDVDTVINTTNSRRDHTLAGWTAEDQFAIPQCVRSGQRRVG